MSFIAQACSTFVEVRERLSMKTCELMENLHLSNHQQVCT